MKRNLSLLLIILCLFASFCGCSGKRSYQGEGLTVTFNNEQGEIKKQTEPVAPLNKAMEKEDVAFQGDRYGVIINNASESDVKAASVETFTYGNASDTIVVMPYYEGSKILIESVSFDIETSNIVPTGTLYETVSTDDYALVVKVDRPSGAIPEMRITVEYDGVVYSNLIKNAPDSDIEYIR